MLAAIVAVIDVIKWPLVAIAGLLILRRPVVDLLSGFKNRSLKYGDAQVGAEQQAQALPAPATPPAHALPPPVELATPSAHPATYLFEAEDNPFVAHIAGLVRQNVESKTFATGTERDRWLYREGAKLEIRIEFERLYRTLFQSQLVVLQLANNALNSGGATNADAKAVYDEAAKRFSEFYQTYPFDSWLRYITNNSLLVQNGNLWAITNKGQLYLHFLTATGYGTRANVKL